MKLLKVTSVAKKGPWKELRHSTSGSWLDGNEQLMVGKQKMYITQDVRKSRTLVVQTGTQGRRHEFDPSQGTKIPYHTAAFLRNHPHQSKSCWQSFQQWQISQWLGLGGWWPKTTTTLRLYSLVTVLDMELCVHFHCAGGGSSVKSLTENLVSINMQPGIRWWAEEGSDTQPPAGSAQPTETQWRRGSREEKEGSNPKLKNFSSYT